MARLMVPSIMLANTNESGYFNPGCVYNGKSVYSLFLSEANVNYVSHFIISSLSDLFHSKHLKQCSIPEMMFTYRRIKRGDAEAESTNYNPLLELNFRNREFIKETIHDIKTRMIPPTAEASHQEYLLEFQNIDQYEPSPEIDWGTRYRHLGDTNSRNVYRWGNRIPPDRVSAQRRNYERNITDSLRARQLVGQIHGYDMSAFMSGHKEPNKSIAYTRY